MSRYRLALIVGLIVLLGVSISRGSRGGLWVLPIGVLVFEMLRRSGRRSRTGELNPKRTRSHKGLPIVGVVALVAAAVLFITYLQSARSRDVEKLSVVVWALPLIADYWAFGVGRGAFGSVFPEYAPSLGNKVYVFPENIVIQWISEWGVPATLLFLGGLIWSFRGRLRIRGTSIGAGAAAGITALLLQNLVDFGLERIASPLALTWALSACSRLRAEEHQPTKGVRKTISCMLVVAGAALWGAALLLARHGPREAQNDLHAAAKLLDVRDQVAVDEFRARLRVAMLETPAEPYLARLGAEISLKAGRSDVLKWSARALELGPKDANTHLLVAKALRRYGALNQAMMHLQLAAEVDENMSPTVGRLAAHWGNSSHDLLRAAPPGSVGARVLTVASRYLPPSREPWRAKVLHAALLRDEDYRPAREALIRDYIRRARNGDCVRQTRCEKRALVLADALIQQLPHDATGVELKSSMLRALGRVHDAERLLSATCARFEDDALSRCMRARIRTELAKDSPSMSNIQSISEMLAGRPCGDERACAKLLTELANAHIRVGDRGGAVAYLERAVRADPTVARLLKIAALAAELEEFYRAEDAIERARRVAKPSDRRRVEAVRASIHRRGRRSISAESSPNGAR